MFSLRLYYRDGIDVGESEEDDSCEYDSEEDEQLDEFEDFLDSNLERYRNAAAPKSGGTFSYRDPYQIAS